MLAIKVFIKSKSKGIEEVLLAVKSTIMVKANISLFLFLGSVSTLMALIVPLATTTRTTITALAASSFYADENTKDHFLLEEFRIHTGEVINPYKVLRVSRTAGPEDIKRSYRDLSRRYHPDGYRNRRNNDILPGKCNSLEDVRDHWERIKLSYEILRDPKRRKRYDRHETLADPGAALKRAAVNAALDGVKSVGGGIFSVGAFAFQKLAEGAKQASKGDK